MLTVAATAEELEAAKMATLKELAKELKLAGFRKGHAPLALVEKTVDPNLLQKQVIDNAVNQLYILALQQEQLRPASQPEVELLKYAPYTTLEIKITLEVVGDVRLPDYKKYRLKKQVKPVTDQDVADVVRNLQQRSAKKAAVKRAAADGDEVTIDFTGRHAASKEAIDGASGTDYPIVLGSGTFIPRFEEELAGLKAGATKTFTIPFPKDYSLKQLQGKKVTFDITVKSVSSVTLPELDTAFIESIGAPFDSVDAFKAGIRAQLEDTYESQATRELENEVLTKLAAETKVALPESLVHEEVTRIVQEEKQNALYRGQTWQEYLAASDTTEEKLQQTARPVAEQRVKTGLALGEVAQSEGVTVTDQELDEQIAALAHEYTDKKMQAELHDPANRRELLTRMITERTIAKLVAYATT